MLLTLKSRLLKSEFNSCYRDDDLVILILPHIVLKHGPEYGRPGTQYCLVALDALLLTPDSHVRQSPRVQQVLHVAHQVPAPVILLLDGVLYILVTVADPKWDRTDRISQLKMNNNIYLHRINPYVVLSLPGMVISQIIVKTSSLM